MKKNIHEANEIFDIIGNMCRRKILQLLILEPHYVSQLSKILNKSQPAILKHMKILESKGIVLRQKESASGIDKGPDRHYFSINKSFLVIYSLSPNNVRELVFNTNSPLNPNDPVIENVTNAVKIQDQVSVQISTINKEIERINKEMSHHEQAYVVLEQQRNRLLSLADSIIDKSDDLKKNYVERQLLRRHVCESQACVKEISNLLNHKEADIKIKLENLRKKNYLEQPISI